MGYAVIHGDTIDREIRGNSFESIRILAMLREAILRLTAATGGRAVFGSAVAKVVER